MTLSTRAWLVAFASASIFLTLLGFFLVTYQERTRIEHDLTLTESLSVRTSQLRTSLFDYLLHPQPDRRSLAEARLKDFDGFLEREAADVAESIRTDEQLSPVWASVRRSTGDLRGHVAEGGGPETEPGRGERDRRHADRILEDSHALAISVSELREHAVARFLATTAREKLALSVLLAGTAGLGLGFFLAFKRAILDPVHRIHAAAIRIARGETHLRLKSHRKDELGELAGAFDRMLDQLQETTVSRDRLEAEVSERRRAEETARQAQTRYQRLVDANAIGVVVTNSAGEVLEANDYYLRLVGYTRAEVVARQVSWRDATPPEWLPADETAIAELNARGICEPYEKEYLRRDGSRVPILLVDAMLPEAGGQILGLALDMTERKRAEAELDGYRHRLEDLVESRTRELKEARIRAEAANRAKSAFLANMSHEIRTPLNAIVGLTYLLHRAGAAPEQTERLRKIDGAAKHLLSIVNDILDLSRIEAGQLALDESDFAPDALLDEVRASIADEADIKGLTVEADGDGLPARVRGDRARLRQALSNYAGNAVKFTDRGTYPDRRAAPGGDPRRFPRALRGSRHWRRDRRPRRCPGCSSRSCRPTHPPPAATAVRAWGLPSPDGWPSRWAERRARRASPAKAAPSGWPSLWVGRATFSPRSRQPPVEDLAKTLRRDYAGARLLLAEDDPTSREVVIELLRETGLVLDIAADGREAVEKARAKPYDLVLMDMQMQGMDGLEATRAIRRLPGWEGTPILAMTANAFAEDRWACLVAGMDDHVAKPVDHDALLATLIAWLSTGRTGTPSALRPSALGSGNRSVVRAEAIPGLDREQGLRRLANRAATYERLLRSYAHDPNREMARLRECLAAGHRREAQRLAHSLKGSSATLGAVAVQACAAELEAAIKAGRSPDECESLIAAVESSFSALARAILARPPEAAPAAPGGIADPAGPNDVLERLEALLALGDIAARTVFQEHETLLRGALGDVADRFAEQIETFAYEQALETLRLGQLRVRLGEPRGNPESMRGSTENR